MAAAKVPELKIVSAKPNSKRVPVGIWNKYKAKIIRLYKTKTMEEVMEHMEKECKLKAT